MKKLKTLLLLLGLTLAKNACFAQNNTSKESYQDFINSLSTTINYPPELFRNCISVTCMIKLQVDSLKNITDMQLSDSADSLFNVEFKKKKSRLNIKQLEGYLKTKYTKSTTTIYLIPFSYTLYQMPCSPPSIKKSFLDAYLKFDGKYLNENVMLLSPIGLLTNIKN